MAGLERVSAALSEQVALTSPWEKPSYTEAQETDMQFQLKYVFAQFCQRPNLMVTEETWYNQ